MALVRCPDCSKEVSDQAPACIHCGRPLKQTTQPGSAKAVEEGVQRSRFRYDAGTAIGTVGVILGIIVLFSDPVTGLVLVVGSMALGLWMAYG